MSTSSSSAYLTVGGLNVDVERKDIKNLHIGVYPPIGRVRVAAPMHFADEQIRLAVLKRLRWIQRTRQQLIDADRQSAREMITGESHMLWGRRLRLERNERRASVRITARPSKLIMEAPADADAETLNRRLEAFYRRELRATLAELMPKWQERIGVRPRGWGVRRMRTKWGSCSRDQGRLWFNVELAKKHPRCLEYIVVHELVHLIERGHGDRFVALMDEFLPDWRSRRDDLNAAPLAEEQWPDGRAA